MFHVAAATSFFLDSSNPFSKAQQSLGACDPAQDANIFCHDQILMPQQFPNGLQRLSLQGRAEAKSVTEGVEKDLFPWILNPLIKFQFVYGPTESL